MTYAKGKSVKLSNNFKSTEFDCQGSGCCSQTIIDEKLVEFLQKIRDHFNAPVTINSAYRCEKHNAAIGGASMSKHRFGQAADISVRGVSPADVAKYAESIGVLGIGLYETAKDGYFVHIDTRTAKSFWYGQDEAYRSTFGGTPIPNTGNATTETTSYPLLQFGSSGKSVEDLQKKLIKLGYSCGSDGADGKFGQNTVNAVKKFQGEAHLNYNINPKLTVDGIVGEKTWNAIDKAINSKIYKVQVTASVLNIRKGAGTNYGTNGSLRNGTVCTIIDEAKGNGSAKGWGKLSTNAGWISLDYCKKI